MKRIEILMVIGLLSLCLAQSDILMTDYTNPDNLNQYSFATVLDPVCDFIYYLMFSQTVDQGIIKVTQSSDTTGVKSSTLISQSTNKFLYQVRIRVPVGSGVSQVEAFNDLFTKQFNVAYSCEAPPSTLDIEFYNNNTLYDNGDTNTMGPSLTFKVKNFLKSPISSMLTATITSQSLVLVANVFLISDNIFSVGLGYNDAITNWSDFYNDFPISLNYLSSTLAPPSNHIIKSNYNNTNDFQRMDYIIYGLSPSDISPNRHIYPYVEFKTNYNRQPFWGIQKQRVPIVMGNYTNGLVISKITLNVAQQVNILLSYTDYPRVSMITSRVTFNIVSPTYLLTLDGINLDNGILLSSVNTNNPMIEVQFKIDSGFSYYPNTLYPYGIIAGTSASYLRNDEFYVSPYTSGQRSFYYNPQLNDFTFPTPTYSDVMPPNIESIENFIYGNIAVYRVHITDDLSGFYEIKGLGNYTSLVSGTLQDGIYEFKVDLEDKYFITVFNFEVLDTVLNRKILDMTTFMATDGSVFQIREFKKLSDINRVYWKYNDIDVSQQGLDNIFYICSSITNLKPHISHSKEWISFPFINAILGIYNNSNGCYEFNVPIHKNFITGSYDAFLWIGINWRQFSYFMSVFGEESRLRVSSINGDALGPLITNIELPSNNVQIQSDTNITWRFTIQDNVNGFKSGIVSIISQVGWVRYNFTLTPTVEGHLVLGDQYNGIYEINVPINVTCVSQKYSIYYIELKDEFGYSTLFNTYVVQSNTLIRNPLMKFYDVDAVSSISTNCVSPPQDIDPPILTSFDFSPKTIDSTFAGELLQNTSRMVTFDFQVSDATGILKESHPVIYLSDQNYNRIEQFSELVSYSITSATYRCKFNIPFGYGFPHGIKVSVYGFVDFNNNIGGYSITSLGTTYSNTIDVVQTMNSSMAILSTSKLYPDLDFYVMGTNFDINDKLIVQHENGTTLYSLDSISNMVTISQFKMGKLKGSFIYITLQRERLPSGFYYSNTFRLPVIYTEPDNESSSTSSSSDSVFPPQQCPNLCSDNGECTANGCKCKSPWIGSDCSILPTNAPQQCINKCSGNGECTPSGCICKPLWIGLDCASKVIIVNPTINTTLPSTNITIPTTSSSESVLYAIISIVQLNELNNNGDIINSYPFTQWIASNNTNS
ncbi:hypothetical protein CYY_010140, partial [Polysphondylium violaceum]